MACFAASATDDATTAQSFAQACPAVVVSAPSAASAQVRPSEPPVTTPTPPVVKLISCAIRARARAPEAAFAGSAPVGPTTDVPAVAA